MSMPSVIKPTPLIIVVVILSVSEAIVEEANLPAPPLPAVSKMIENLLDHLRSKQLRNGYAMYIMRQNNFQTWMQLAKQDKMLWPWFQSFLDELLDSNKSSVFDEACRYIMDRLLKFAKNAMENRKSNTNDSLEYSCFHFFASNELATICSILLPTEPMQTIKSG